MLRGVSNQTEKARPEHSYHLPISSHVKLISACTWLAAMISECEGIRHFALCHLSRGAVTTLVSVVNGPHTSALVRYRREAQKLLGSRSSLAMIIMTIITCSTYKYRQELIGTTLDNAPI